MQTIFTELQQEWAAGREAVLVSVVGHSGSVPRGKGAQMLVGEQGLLCGTIGGGPAEYNAVEKAKQLLHGRKSDVHQYILRQNPMEDVGAVCGGDVTVLFHPAPAGNAAWSQLAEDVLSRLTAHRPGYLVLQDPPILSDVPTEAAPSLPLPITQRAIIFGAGHCSAALCPLLTTVGFRVTVFDDRPALAAAERFPAAAQIIAGDFSRLEEYLRVTEEDYVVVMTSGHGHDYEVLRQILRQKCAYVGVIGSHAKAAAVNEKLRLDGIGDDMLSAVHSPIGTAIGAVTPEEIAVSIAGEMILVRASRREASGVFSHGCPMH